MKNERSSAIEKEEKTLKEKHGLKIVKLQIENVQKIKAVEITPESNVIEVTGKNGAGKTSILDSIMMALGGEKVIPEKPIREGTRKGKVIVDLEKFKITRSFTPSGGTIKVESAEGAAFKSPQSLLNSFFSTLSFCIDISLQHSSMHCL